MFVLLLDTNIFLNLTETYREPTKKTKTAFLGWKNPFRGLPRITLTLIEFGFPIPICAISVIRG